MGRSQLEHGMQVWSLLLKKDAAEVEKKEKGNKGGRTRMPQKGT